MLRHSRVGGWVGGKGTSVLSFFSPQHVGATVASCLFSAQIGCCSSYTFKVKNTEYSHHEERRWRGRGFVHPTEMVRRPGRLHFTMLLESF